MLSEFSLPDTDDSEPKEYMFDKQELLAKLKENLTQAQARMKKYADSNRTERQLEVGDMVI
jgi:hypothetical protein